MSKEVILMFNPMLMFNPGNGQNPMMQAMQMMGNMQNPQQMMQGMLQNNPLFQRAQQMAQGKSEQELEQVARNLCQQRGVDFEAMKQQFQNMIGNTR